MTTARTDADPQHDAAAAPGAPAPARRVPLEKVARPDPSPAAPAVDPAVLEDLERLRTELDDLVLPLPTPGAGPAAAARTALRAQLDDHLLPRLRRLDAPLLAVVGGSTGAGKSTLVNSLVGRVVTTSGVLRPTTRRPTLVHAPADAGWFSSREVLPGLSRTTGVQGPGGSTSGPAGTVLGGQEVGATGLHLVSDAAMPAGLALLDAPDIDSVVVANRELSAQLLRAADLWLFVTTASRYGDAVPWEVLAGAVERGTALAVVLDRVPTEPPGVGPEVRADLTRLLAEAGLASAPLFVLPEAALVDDALPAEATEELRTWLGLVGSDARRREQVVRRTLAGALASLAPRLEVLAVAAEEQQDAEASLRAVLGEVYAGAEDGVADHLTDGTLLRGEVLARWQEFVGTGAFLSALQAAVGRARDRVGDVLRHRPPPVRRLDEAMTTGVAALVLEAAADARERSLAAWRSDPAGAVVLATAPPSAVDPALPDAVGEQVERLVRDWQSFVLALVAENGQGRRTRARLLSFGVSGTGAVLMMAVFASTAGVTGAEVGIAGGTAVLAQRVLEAVFGEDAVRRLASVAREDLQRRVGLLLERQSDALASYLPPLPDSLPRRLRRPLRLGALTAVPPVPASLLRRGRGPFAPGAPDDPVAPVPEAAPRTAPAGPGAVREVGPADGRLAREDRW